MYRLQHTAGLNPKAFQARYARAGPAYGAGFYPVEPLKPADNKMLQVPDCRFLLLLLPATVLDRPLESGRCNTWQHVTALVGSRQCTCSPLARIIVARNVFAPPPPHPPLTPHPPPFPRMLQGDVLWSFLDMDQRAQAAVAGAVGCDVNDLLRDLQALTVATHMF